MSTSISTAPRHSRATLAVLVAALSLASCSSVSSTSASEMSSGSPIVKADQPFAAGGDIEMKLESGNYTVRPGSGDRIRVTFDGNQGNAAAALEPTGTHATLSITSTPTSNFRATVEVPAAANLTVHLSAGDLTIKAIAGNKKIDSKAGNVEIDIPNANDYSTVDASAQAGNVDAEPFGKSASGLGPHIAWSGPGKYTLRATLGAGNLDLKR